jgi:hypothetical protein
MSEGAGHELMRCEISDTFSPDFAVAFGATFFHAIVSALFSVVALVFASRTWV